MVFCFQLSPVLGTCARHTGGFSLLNFRSIFHFICNNSAIYTSWMNRWSAGLYPEVDVREGGGGLQTTNPTPGYGTGVFCQFVAPCK